MENNKQSKEQKILVTVKTYPTISKKYIETVCTAGLREDGTWVRIYPVPFRTLDEKQQYTKYDWLNCRLARNEKDDRPESFRPVDPYSFDPIDHVGTGKKRDWEERRKLVLESAQVYESLDEIIKKAKANEISLAVFKPTKIIDFIREKADVEWDKDKLLEAKSVINQYGLFEDNSWRDQFKTVRKLPFDFSYRFEDINERESTLQVLDWEVGTLYWNCFKSTGENADAAWEKVRQKYYDEFVRTDIHFFLGTTLRWHRVAPNPWLIIGVMPIPHQIQTSLFSL